MRARHKTSYIHKVYRDKTPAVDAETLSRVALLSEELIDTFNLYESDSMVRFYGCKRIIGYSDIRKRSCLEERALAATRLANDAYEHFRKRKQEWFKKLLKKAE